MGPGPRGGVLGPERERALAQDWSGLIVEILVCTRSFSDGTGQDVTMACSQTGAVSPPDGSVLIGGGNSVPAKLHKDLLFTFTNQDRSELVMMQGICLFSGTRRKRSFVLRAVLVR